MARPHDAMAQLRARFLERARNDRAEIAAAWSAEEYERVRSIAHALAGAGGMFGFPDISSTARRLETALDERGPGAEASQHLEALLASLSSLH